MTTSNIVILDSEVDKNDEQNDRNAIEEKCHVHKRRSFASQCTATFAANMIKFSFGTLNGFNAILLPELYKKDSEIPMTLDQLTWFNSYCFMLPISAIITGLLPKPMGCRVTLLLAAIMYITSGIIFYYATSATMLLIAQSVLGLFYAVSFVPGASYIIEITQPQFRSAFVASGNLFVLIGDFFSVLMGSLLHWRTTALVNLIFPVVGFVAVYFVPNSPYWLTDKGRFDEAEKSLAWLRGWALSQEVKDELSIMQDNLKSKSTNRAPSVENLHNSGIKDKIRNKLRNYLNRGFCMPLAVIFFLFVIRILTGSHLIVTHSIIIFGMMNSPIDNHLAAVILSALRIIGAVLCISIIHKTGIRKLLFSSLAVAGVSILIAAIFLFLINQKILSEPYAWVPSIMILLSNIASSCGPDKICFILNAELFPTKVRTVGAGFGYFINCVLLALGSKVYLYCIRMATLEGVLLLFGLINIVGIALFYFIIPETQGKSLKEIDELYLRNKKK